MDKKDFSLLSTVAIKEFNFSFDEILNMIQDKLSQGGAKALAEHIFNWLSEVISNNYPETILPNMENTCCDIDLKHLPAGLYNFVIEIENHQIIKHILIN